MEAKEGRLSIDHHLSKCLTHLWALEDKIKGQSPSSNRYIIVQGEPTSHYIVCFCPVYVLLHMFTSFGTGSWCNLNFLKLTKHRLFIVIPHKITASDYFLKSGCVV